MHSTCTTSTRFLLLFIVFLVLYSSSTHGVPVKYKTFNIAGSYYVDGVTETYDLGEFTPLTQIGAAIMNEQHEIFISDTSNHVIRKILSNGSCVLYAGVATAGYNGEGLDALQTQFNGPTGLSLSTNGDLYLADTGNSMIRKISSKTMKVSTLGTSKDFKNPMGVFALDDVNVYVADTGNDLVKHVNTLTGKITIVAGGGSILRTDVLATNSKVPSPQGIYVTKEGVIFVSDMSGFVRKIEGSILGQQIISNLNSKFISPKGIFMNSNNEILVADSGINGVKLISSDRTKTTILAGNGTDANGEFINAKLSFMNQPSFVHVTPQGDVLITEKSMVKKLKDGMISTLIGRHSNNLKYGDGMKATNYGVTIHPSEIRATNNGELIIVDSDSHTVRKVLSNGVIVTIAGIPKTFGYNGDGKASQVLLSNPIGAFVYENGEILITDKGNNLIRVIQKNGNITTLFNVTSPISVFATGFNSTHGEIYFSNATGIYKCDTFFNAFLVYKYQTSPFLDAAAMKFHVSAQQDGNVIFLSEYGHYSLVKYYEKNQTQMTVYQDTNNQTVTSIFVKSNTVHFVKGNSRIVQLQADGSIQHVAGVGPIGGYEVAGYSGESKNAKESMIRFPNSLFVSDDGEVFFSEKSGLVRKVTREGHLISVAGHTPFKIGPTLTQSIFPTVFGVAPGQDGGLIFNINDPSLSNLLLNLDSKGGVNLLAGHRALLPLSPNKYEGPLAYSFIGFPFFTFDLNGDLIIIDSKNHVIYKVDHNNDTISLLAGDPLYSGFSEDGTPSHLSKLRLPKIPVITSNNEIIFAEAGSGRIRKLSHSGTLLTVVVNATKAIQGLVVSQSGDIYFTDVSSHVIKMFNISSSTVSVVAGNGKPGFYGEGISALEASLKAPSALAFTSNGDLLVLDTGNFCIRKISNGNITTVAGVPSAAGVCSYNGDGLLSTFSCISGGTSMFVGKQGEVIFGDTANGLIRKLVPYCEGNYTLDSTYSDCTCLKGWTGTSCDIPTCNGISAVSNTVCSGRGQCKNPNMCSCDTGFEGNFCEISSQTTTIIVAVVVPIATLAALVLLVGIVIAALVLGLKRRRDNQCNDIEMNQTQLTGVKNETDTITADLQTISDFPSDASVNFAPLLSSNSRESTRVQQDPFSRYQNIQKIGQGGFASVFKAHDSKTNKTVAVKVLKFSSMDELNNLMKEGIELLKISHVNILKVNDVFVSKDQLLCLDMEFCDYGDLYRFTSGQIECSENMVKQIIYQICNALSYIHGTLNIIHRDIKPSNIFIKDLNDHKIWVVLADFGLAKGNTIQSEHQSYAGTPLYMSPEICMGCKYYYNTDVYSLGVTIYQIMTRDVYTSISHILLSKDPQESKQFLKSKMMMNHQYSEELVDAVVQMMDKDNLTRPNAQDILSLPYFKN
ncbi:hypothetical protein C9374_002334 [Naegleria lovaniensis]|uniref:non-specific serine/threonine protein kinase n=1 Tax=Naegleria lovaniensis TaxID=51637 RepID=A0AA88KKA5_NAELO|nr:uncharacterized protein C9374_002334 [Naegleria lovaniensis]KAG2386590.1 hypothetical protein C9374_002334 [Naegleria lovaniensis]